MSNTSGHHDPGQPSAPVEQSPSQPVRNAFLRGAKIGALVAGSIMGLVGIIGFVPTLNAPNLGEVDVRTTGAARTIAGVAGGILLSAFYGAVVGALIIGGRAAIRARRRSSADSPAGE